VSNNNRALVLLGYSGSGKDTLTNLAQNRLYGVGNCKFGDFNKRIVAEALSVPRSYMEDKQWRTEHDVLHSFGVENCSYHLSPFDILSILFEGGTSQTPAAHHYRKCYQAYTLHKARAYKLPVFTDIRHHSELMAVKGEFDTCVVFINVPWLPPSPNDGNIRELAKLPKVQHLVRHAVEPSYATFERLLEITNNYWN
jgi:hypothetical protein